MTSAGLGMETSWFLDLLTTLPLCGTSTKVACSHRYRVHIYCIYCMFVFIRFVMYFSDPNQKCVRIHLVLE